MPTHTHTHTETDRQTDRHTHTHSLTLSLYFSLSLFLSLHLLICGELSPLLKWNKIQQRLFHIGGAYKVNILSFSGAKCSIVQQSGTRFNSKTMTGCLHTLFGLNQNSVPLPTIQQVSFSHCTFWVLITLGLFSHRIKGPKAVTRAVPLQNTLCIIFTPKRCIVL